MKTSLYFHRSVILCLFLASFFYGAVTRAQHEMLEEQLTRALLTMTIYQLAELQI